MSTCATLQNECPPEHGQDDGDTRPDVVKRDNQRPGDQAQEPVCKGAGSALAMQEDEELSPRTMLKHMGQPDYQEIDRGK